MLTSVDPYGEVAGTMVQLALQRTKETSAEATLGALLSEIFGSRSKSRPRVRRVFAERRTVDGQVCDVEVHEVSPALASSYVVVVRPVGRLPDETDLRQRFDLTRQQARVAMLLMDRLSDREIAEALGIAHETARNHVKIVRLKLGARSRREIPDLIRALRWPLGLNHDEESSDPR